MIDADDKKLCSEIQSGAYNAIIKGYIRLALRNAKKSEDEIDAIMDYQQNLFGDYTAEYALQVSRREV